MSEQNATRQTFHPDALRDRVYLVTGGSQGIGMATVFALLNAGGRVVTMARREGPIDALRRAAKKAGLGDRLRALTGDVADEVALAAMVDTAVSTWGRISGLVHNAMHNPRLPFDGHPEGAFRASWEINTLAAWRLSQHLLPHFRAEGGGAVVYVSSILASQTWPSNAAYTSSKAALEGLTRALAVELAPDRVRVNTLVPGYIVTPHQIEQNPADEKGRRAKRLQEEYRHVTFETAQPWRTCGVADDVAGPILFLLSDAARFITGTSLAVDGGIMVDLRYVQDDRRIATIREIERIGRELQDLGLPPPPGTARPPGRPATVPPKKSTREPVLRRLRVRSEPVLARGAVLDHEHKQYDSANDRDEPDEKPPSATIRIVEPTEYFFSTSRYQFIPCASFDSSGRTFRLNVLYAHNHSSRVGKVQYRLSLATRRLCCCR
jgi:3-oxoacyl-[acyl-carrier protein] reductase